MALPVVLASSMKSFLKIAPELPPPPYTAEMTTSDERAFAVPGSAAMVAATTSDRLAAVISRRALGVATEGCS